MDDEESNDRQQHGEGRPPQVRIIGAEPAAQRASRARSGEHGGAPATGDEFPWPRPADPWSSDELPHWTEAPTGEVPAVLARDEPAPAADDPWAQLPSPTWREEHADWEAHEEAFAPSMLADDRPLGALDDRGESDQPWAFDLPEHEASHAPATRPVAPYDVASEEAAQPEAPAATAAAPPRPVDPGGGGGIYDVEQEAATVGEPHAAPPRLSEADISEPPVPEAPTVSDPVTEPVSVTPAAAPRGRAAPAPRARGAARARRGPPLPAAERPAEEREQVPPAEDLLGPQASSASERAGRSLRTAVATGLLIGIVTLVFFKLGNAPAAGLCTVLVALAAVEGFSAFRRAGYRPATLLGLTAVVAVMIATYLKGEQAVPLVVVMLVAFGLIWYIAGVEQADAVQGTAVTLLVFCWVGVFGSYAALLLNPTLFPGRHGIAYLVGAVIAAIAYDVGALAVGSWIGRRPLAPSISPGKTWEGLVGGALCSIAASVVVVHAIHPWTLSTALGLGIVVAVVSPLGDLGESLLKRRLGLKDMGRLLPGHGGLLDRIDGILFVMPATYYLVKAVHLG